MKLCVKKTVTNVFTPETKHKALPKLEIHLKTHIGIKLVKKVLALSFIWHL